MDLHPLQEVASGRVPIERPYSSLITSPICIWNVAMV
jgi:hypothetical protein